MMLFGSTSIRKKHLEAASNQVVSLPIDKSWEYGCPEWIASLYVITRKSKLMGLQVGPGGLQFRSWLPQELFSLHGFGLDEFLGDNRNKLHLFVELMDAVEVAGNSFHCGTFVDSFQSGMLASDAVCLLRKHFCVGLNSPPTVRHKEHIFCMV